MVCVGINERLKETASLWSEGGIITYDYRDGDEAISLSRLTASNDIALLHYGD